ncbi:MAG TPA: preprotein translocase subunit YajC [Thermodesulfobacteriota bacterium]|nr:preprotein translocase subunit YajC [Thermodesulfobacteriota bacterium]
MQKKYIAIITLSLMSMGGCQMPAGEGGGGGAGAFTSFLPLILIFVLFYFLILRPQQKQGRKRADMLKSLKRGDNVITSGGIYGKIVSVADDVMTIEIAKGVNIRVSRSGIAGLQAEGSELKEDKSGK